jgi:hypothetical protein
MKERWKPVFGGIYAVSDRGRVRREAPGINTFPGKILRPCPVPDWYVVGVAVVNGKRISYNVHVLVAEAFLGPRPRGKQVNHKDGDKHNNVWKNLEYKTPKQNQQHSSKLGLIAYGERNGNSKLTEKKVAEMREKFAISKPSYVQLGRQFGVTKEMASLIIRRKNWVR